ncbi:uncharacterized protein LY89DRAFT_742153 [Mollisia scopiformis]|uniref:Uncharacterized protein n=1 Tax=Mollisia scopiformis TaxID=149040 RepID=A0A132B7C9_MOLSC|nr:uncharacterized protein LY89DRAFT_742153 [Mollisia scopiformis]KUJ08315.1 hypothetical protein LY89DRAFT_742153 [Mollisia scopiformis]
MSDSGGCTLTPQARAFSSILSAFIGSVVNGLTSGYMIAFITGWIAWFAFFRVVIGGSYMFYRSVTGTWTVEQSVDQYEIPNRATSPDPESDAQASLINRGSNNQLYENPARNASTTHPPILSELPLSSAEEYLRTVYTTVFTQDTSLAHLPKQSPLSTFWPTRSDLLIRQQTTRLAQQKRSELRTHFASTQDLERALRAYPRLYKQGKLSGLPPPLMSPYLAPLNRDVTVLGWIGWVYSAVYAPISQIIWIAANASTSSSSSGIAKIVKGISVAVTALPLCLDSRVRFADSLQKKKRFGGTWAYYAFNLTNAASCTLQGLLCGALLVWGVVEARSDTDPFFASSFPWPLVAIYPIFSLVWAFGSFRIVPMMDGGRKRASQAHWAGYFLDVGMGVFAGLFLAAPAFALYFSSVEPGMGEEGARDLGQFLECEVPGWQKFSAIFP